MTPQELKNSILQLAIQGKLVEQRPEEGTAEELYRKIQQEKQKLIKEGKIKKEKPFSTNTNYTEFPFEIPNTWIFVRFGELMISRDAERIPVSTEERSHRQKIYDYYGASGVIDKIDDYIFDKTLLLIGEDGANLLNRSTPIAFLARGQYWVNNHAHVLDACNGLSLEYVCYFINAISLVPYVTGTAQPKMNQENMNAIWVPLPPYIEQKRIVAKIEELLPLIDRYEKAWSRLEELNKRFPDEIQKSILQMAIQGKLVEQRSEEGTGETLYQQIQQEKRKSISKGKVKREKIFPDIAEEEKAYIIPASWKWVRLNSIYNFIDYRGITPKKIDEGIRLIGSGNIRKRYLDFSKENKFISHAEYDTRKSRGITKEGDILFITEGGSMGFASLNTWKGECSCGQRVITLQQYGNNQLLNNEFFLNCILSDYFQHAIRERITGSAALGIKGDTLKQVLVPLPPLAEQQRIVSRIKELLSLCEKLNGGTK